MSTPFSNTLQFADPSEITFTCSSNELRFYVKGDFLGAINSDYAVTVYVTVVNGIKSITMTQISNSVYLAGNTNDPLIDTVYYKFNDRTHPPFVADCSSAPNCFKLYGWDDEEQGQVCVGCNSFTNYFNISGNLMFKARIEQVVINNQNKIRLVARYTGNIYLNVAPSAADCYNCPYCYVCNM